MTVLTTDRLTLRPPASRDGPAMLAFYQSERAQFVGGGDLRQAWIMATSIFGHWTYRGYGLFAVTQTGDDTIIGLVGPWFPAMWPETELGWLMFDGHEGKGLAFEAATAARTHCRDTLGWTDIVSYIAPANHRSIRLAQRLDAVFDPFAAQPNATKTSLVYRHPEAR